LPDSYPQVLPPFLSAEPLAAGRRRSILLLLFTLVLFLPTGFSSPGLVCFFLRIFSLLSLGVSSPDVLFFKNHPRVPLCRAASQASGDAGRNRFSFSEEFLTPQLLFIQNIWIGTLLSLRRRGRAFPPLVAGSPYWLWRHFSFPLSDPSRYLRLERPCHGASPLFLLPMNRQDRPFSLRSVPLLPVGFLEIHV